MSEPHLQIGIIDYFATGEGRTVFIFCNYDKVIPEQVDSYYHRGVMWYSVELLTKDDLSVPELQTINFLQEYAPFLCKAAKKCDQKAMFTYYQECYMNWS